MQTRLILDSAERPLVHPVSPPPPSSATMPWLSRNSSQSPYTPSKAVKIPEPKRVRTIDILTPPRSGTLGTGAVVVRTPEEALRETGVRLSPEKGKVRTSATADKKEKKISSSTPRQSLDASATEPISPPTSPPLPPLPLPETDETNPSSRRSSMKSHSRSISTADDAPTVPPLPAHIVASSQPPPFHGILVSEPPSMIMDASKIIVTLETCTATYRTTLSTINSRPSQLSKFLSSVVTQSGSARSSVYSTESDDLAMYRRHLTSQGLLPHSSNIHLFLDRPSAPYIHILNYLRSPVIEGQPDSLPRALQLINSSAIQSRLDNLIEVRDEAGFLGLEDLQRLCTEDIRMRHGPRLHTRGNSAGGSVHSLHASVYSLRTLSEHSEMDMTNPPNPPTSPPPQGADIAPVRKNKIPVKTTRETSPPRSSPPTPQSWEGPILEQRSQSRQSKVREIPKSPPAGWI
ncbi:hypothetical protein M413DRAFT_16870 [Hebeloma cylindrosporum]|uniref:BTB domain-containing protein n=1 Tax=Hebeloma cylindrosporum TaxID=76867 RepID=A0A0C3CPW2_HEBCY|nr:hypothetical protein M413DRAFT_16870 [Hebeloma cylindrosporum h7]